MKTRLTRWEEAKVTFDLLNAESLRRELTDEESLTLQRAQVRMRRNKAPFMVSGIRP